MKILKFKETICEEDNLILLHKNCENCGAPLKLNKETMTCKCNYCDTEYYAKTDISSEDGYNILGQLITLNIRGEIKKFYIAEESFHTICSDSHIGIDGNMRRNCIATKEILKLIEI